MKLNRATLPLNKDEVFEEDIDFSNQVFDENHVKRILSCSVKVVAHEYGDVLDVKISGKASVIASCSYTLEDVPLDISFRENFYFSSEVTGSDECFFEPGNEIDLDSHILALILAEVPHNITKSGATLPKSGPSVPATYRESVRDAQSSMQCQVPSRLFLQDCTQKSRSARALHTDHRLLNY